MTSSIPVRHALITGGTAGLGLECTHALLASSLNNWHIYIASRNAVEGEKIARELNEGQGRVAVTFIRLDLGSLSDIRAFAKSLLTKNVKLDALICNAGLQIVGDIKRTTDDIEATFGVNHLGHFLLTHALTVALKRGARIVVVSSGTHDPAKKTGIPAPMFIDPDLLAKPELDTKGLFIGGDNALVSV